MCLLHNFVLILFCLPVLPFTFLCATLLCPSSFCLSYLLSFTQHLLSLFDIPSCHLMTEFQPGETRQLSGPHTELLLETWTVKLLASVHFSQHNWKCLTMMRHKPTDLLMALTSSNDDKRPSKHQTKLMNTPHTSK